jgi:hypothetical protein
MVLGISRLIVGTSGSPGSLRALRYGEFLARAHQAVLMPVIAWEPPGGERAERICPSGPLREVFRNQACQRLRDALVAVWGEIPADPMVQPHVERGPAGWVLVSLACQPADVLLVGAGRRSASRPGQSSPPHARRVDMPRSAWRITARPLMPIAAAIWASVHCA